MNSTRYDAYIRYLDVLSDSSIRGNAVDPRLFSLSGWLGLSLDDVKSNPGVLRDVLLLANTVDGEAGRESRPEDGLFTCEFGRDQKLGEVSTEGSGSRTDGLGSRVNDGDVRASKSREGKPKVVTKSKLRRQERRAKMFGTWKGVDGSGGCISDSGSASVCTVDTRTAVELEAIQTLAARRVVENKLAIAQGNARLRSYADRAKTDAYARLAEARMEQRINEAKAKSQASFKKCDESLKSLGSTGSAGEFAMRREIQKAKRSEEELSYIKAQADILIKYATPAALAECNNVPPPKKVDAFEIFGDCPSEYSEEEAEAYYLELQKMNEEEDLRFTTQFA